MWREEQALHADNVSAVDIGYADNDGVHKDAHIWTPPVVLPVLGSGSIGEVVEPGPPRGDAV